MLLVPETLEQYHQDMKTALEEERYADAAAIAPQLSAGRIARVLREAPREAVEPCLLAMDLPRAGRVLAQMPPEYASEVLVAMEDGTAAKLFKMIPADHAADILEDMDQQEIDILLAEADEQYKRAVTDLARYKRGTAGAVMIPHFIAVERGKTVGQTLKALLAAPSEVERSSYVYVVDDNHKLLGVLSVKDILRVDPGETVESAMLPNVVAVRVDDLAAQAARLIRLRRFTMLPVLDHDDRLVGVINFDDAMDILAEDIAEQLVHFGAASAEESFFTPPREAVKMRLPWMAANIFLNLGAVAVITGFEDTIAAVAILAAFLPMITDMGGNVGIQSLSVAIRSIALGEVRLRDYSKAIRKEVVIGLFNGVALGLLFAIIAYIWQGNAWIGALAGIALAINVLVAGVVGGTMPFLIKRIGKDPAMMTGPVLTTITDITGVFIYLGLCTLFLSNVLGNG
ncbi:MAG: magnesium transporter [Phycisphaerales bacterium]|nr:magnesium transporter [Planctomycetota bacterium]MCH8509221.1 magnesium transporter [Phycisphaerales bacterium]